MLETLAQAYRMNGNRDDAVRSIEDALALMDAPKPGEAPTLSWTEFSTLLRGYQSKPLSHGCPSRAKP